MILLHRGHARAVILNEDPCSVFLPRTRTLGYERPARRKDYHGHLIGLQVAEDFIVMIFAPSAPNIQPRHPHQGFTSVSNNAQSAEAETLGSLGHRRT